ncbi:unnamed protein product [Cuscuta campestris]|uniref:Essential protein Yae1 N-terminal domain-containing protein n=1 Tax=Cuscuta campestris TaxID=132261 RepID=A0A484LYP1_9ASTE|nr:unnamed protein product [Cuscuta campestris]
MGSPEANTTEDIFDSSLNLEEIHYKEGHSDGYAQGLSSCVEEGRQVGLKTGFETGLELGFYRGCIDVWNSAIGLDQACFSSRMQKNVKKMDELLQKYPLSDPENESVSDVMESLQIKFRAICATLKVKLELDGCCHRASDPQKTGF